MSLLREMLFVNFKLHFSSHIIKKMHSFLGTALKSLSVCKVFCLIKPGIAYYFTLVRHKSNTPTADLGIIFCG